MTTANRYRKKPVVITALPWTGTNEGDLVVFTGSLFRIVEPEDGREDPDITAEVLDVLHSTWVGVKTGQWIIRGVQGEYYPCDAAVFDATYEEVVDD